MNVPGNGQFTAMPVMTIMTRSFLGLELLKDAVLFIMTETLQYYIIFI